MQIQRLQTISEKNQNKGILSVVENQNIPFEIKRVFYVYDLPKHAIRGNHANNTLQEFIICLQGSLEIILENQKEKKEYILDNPAQGLYIPEKTWLTIKALQENTIYIVLASEVYQAEDAIRDYNQFQLLNK